MRSPASSLLLAPLLAPLVVGACGWTDRHELYPWVYTPEQDLEDWAHVRWETEDWDPATDKAKTASYLIKMISHRKGAPVESLEHFEAMRGQVPPLGEGVRISFVGDVMWVGDNWSTFLGPVAPLLDGDLRVGNLETPTSPEHPTSLDELGLYTFNAPPEMLDGLPLDLLQLNNNHSLDVGDAGLEATIAEVEARGFAHTGVDGFTTQRVGELDVAFLAYSWGHNDRHATTGHDLHVVPFGQLGVTPDFSVFEADIRAARDAGADTVVVLVHWGYEYEYYPDPHMMQWGRELVIAGADVVVGSGPHVVQPPELCQVNAGEGEAGVGACRLRTDDGEPRTAAILYSLGNMGTVMRTEACQVGVVTTVSLDPDVTGLGWTAAAATRTGPGPLSLPMNQVTDEALLAEYARLQAHLGTEWER